MKQIKDKLNNFMQIKFVKNIMNYIFISVVAIIGFYFGKISHKLNEVKPIVKTVNPFMNTKELLETSIATNEKGQLLIIDKKTGKYTIYSDEVGKVIFKLYTNKFYTEISN